MKRHIFFLGLLLALFACNSNPKPEADNPPKETADPASLSEVIARLTDSINADSTNAILYVHRAQAYLMEDRAGAAMVDLSRALQLNPSNIDTYLLLSNVYYMLGDEANINATLNRAIEIDPQDTRPLVKLGELNLLRQNNNVAAAYIDKALKIQPYNPKAYFVKGMYFIMAQQDTASALKSFQLAAEQDDRFYDPVEQICRIYAVQQPPYALDYLRKVQKQFPEQANSRYELALYLQSHGRHEEALAHYDTLLVHDPDNPIVLYNIGYVNFVYLNDNETALAYFDKTLEVNPNYLDAYFNKGRVLEQMGKYAQAQGIYKEVLNRQPDYKLAIDGINRIQNQVKE